MYAWGPWSTPGCGKVAERTEVEMCRADDNNEISGCQCGDQRAVKTENRDEPCCKVKYNYDFGEWSNPEPFCGKLQARTEVETCVLFRTSARVSPGAIPLEGLVSAAFCLIPEADQLDTQDDSDEQAAFATGQ